MAQRPRKRRNADDHVGRRASALIETTITTFLNDGAARQAAIDRARADLPDVAVKGMEAALNYKAEGYREVVLIQTAYQLSSDRPEDLTRAVEGARPCGKRLGDFLRANHISGTKDAYQGIGKNTSNLARGILPDYDELLRWTATAGRERILMVFEAMAARLAALSKPVKSMPDLDQGALDFGAVAALLDDLLDRPSEGAYQQFLVAAFLEAAIEEFGAGGVNGLRSETKSLTATDRSSKVPGDVQIRQRGSTIAAFEVTANDWTTKLRPALDTAHDNGLGRVHVLASVAGGALSEPGWVRGTPADVSVLDVKAFLHTVTAFLQKPTRATALRELHRLLVSKQPRLERVNAYVDALHAHRLVLAPDRR